MILGCEKTKMRGHKCSYRVKLTMRLGYVNHWFVEVLGDHDQFGSINDSVPTPSSLSPSIQKGENGDGSLNSDLNKMHTKTSSANTSHHLNSPADSYVTMVPQGTIAMPNSLPNNFHSVLPNTIYTTPSMNLPVNLPVLTQQAIIPSQNLPLFMTAGTNIQRDSAYMGMVMSEFSQQDVPLPLVKMKKEPMDNGYDKTSPIDSSESNSLDSFHSNTQRMSVSSRAKARKKFTPYQLINTSLKENETKQDLADSTTLCNSDHQSVHRNGNQRGTSETRVRRELRDLVAKRELDRCLGVQTNQNDEEISDSLRQLISEGEIENGYTYIWDEDLTMENGKADKVESNPEVQIQDKPRFACCAYCLVYVP